MISPCYLYSYHKWHSNEQSCSIQRFSGPFITFPLSHKVLNCPQVGGSAIHFTSFLYLLYPESCHTGQQPKHPRAFSCSCQIFSISVLSTTVCLLQRHKPILGPTVTPSLISILMSSCPCSTRADSAQSFPPLVQCLSPLLSLLH